MIQAMTDLYSAAAYGGPGWSPRKASLEQEIGSLWTACGVSTEWVALKAVLLHPPGPELGESDPDSAQILAPIDAGRARRQHDALAYAYEDAGTCVHYVDPGGPPSPNLIFVADLLFMTPEGAIVARPASTVRAGEERQVAQRLAGLGMPILRTVRGTGTFEGADACWIDPGAVLLATGLRTNREGAAQVAAQLEDMGVDVINVGLPYGAMHLMGTLRFAGPDLALAWPGRVPYAAVDALRERGFQVLFIPDEHEAKISMALNFVTLGPGRILMPSGCPRTQAFYEATGIDCTTLVIDELVKAAGSMGCLTGILHRQAP
jgi:arginine deiminase